MPRLNPVFLKRIRRAGIVLLVVLGVFVVFLLCLSPIAKYLIEKYDKQILGRTIEVSWVYVNPFTGYVYLSNVKVYEQKDDTVFFKANGISADFSMLKLLKKTYEISSVTVYHPWGHIVQNGHEINFRDIIEFYKPKKPKPPRKEPVHFNILDCKIVEGIFQYDELITPATYYIKHVNINSPGKWWNVDTMLFNITFESGPTAGTAKGNMSINFKSLDYRFGTVIDTFDLKPLSQYMRVLSNYGDFGGIFNANVDGAGNFRNKFDLKTHGLISIHQFQFGPSIYEDYGSFQRLVLDIGFADPAGKKYLIDSIMLDRPYFRYEKYDSLDNLALMFGKAGSHKGGGTAQFNLILKIAEYLQELLKNFARSDYTIGKFTVYKGNFVFNDFSPYERFSVDAMPVHIKGDSINKSNSRIALKSKIEVRPYGKLELNVYLDPKNYGTFDIDYGIENVPVSLFNPYLITYTSFPLNRGTLQLRGQWHVLDSMINSANHLLIMDPRVGKRIRGQDTKWIPVPLIMSIAREAGEVIDYEIPVKGNLKKPLFDIRHVILDVVKNIFVKPPLTPYLMRVHKLENTVEKMLNVDWTARQVELNPVEERFVGDVAEFLQHNPGNKITVAPQIYEFKEKEHIAYFEAKKRFYIVHRMAGKILGEDDSIAVEELSVKDSTFQAWLDKLAGDSMMFSTLQKCRFAVTDNLIERRFKQLNEARRKAFLEQFDATGTTAQIKFKPAEMGVPFNGFSRYKIDYNGELPDKLRKAYERIDEANHQSPRKKYQKIRWMPKVKGLKRRQ
jgi:hypothetical protein